MNHSTSESLEHVDLEVLRIATALAGVCVIGYGSGCSIEVCEEEDILAAIRLLRRLSAKECDTAAALCAFRNGGREPAQIHTLPSRWER